MDRTLAPLLRIATKYQFTRLRSRLLAHFAINWPFTFEAFEASEETVEGLLRIAASTAVNSQHEGTVAGGTHTSNDDLAPMDLRLPEPLNALWMAFSCDVPELMPSIYYEIIRLPWVSHTNGRCRCGQPNADSNTQGEAKAHAGSRHGDRRVVEVSDLTAAQMYHSSKVREILAGLVNDFAAEPVRSARAKTMCLRRSEVVGENVDEDNRIHDPCMDALVDYWEENVLPALLASPEGIRDPMRAIRRLSRDDTLRFGMVELYGLCDVCDEDLSLTMDRTKRKWWTALTDYFCPPRSVSSSC
jgi:hypothetical protein